MRRRGRDRYRPRELHRARHEVSCVDLIAFAEGQITPARAAAFRVHLKGCATCRRELTEVIQRSAQLSDPPRSGR